MDKSKLKKKSKVSKSMVFTGKKGFKKKKKFVAPMPKNFFETVKEDTEKIHQFMKQSEIQEEEDGDHIVKIIEKTKKQEERLNKKLVDEKMKMRLMNLKNTHSLIDIRNRIQQDTKEQVKKLNRKNQDLVKELNKVTDRIRRQKSKMHQLQNTLDNTRVPTNEEYLKFLNEKKNLIIKGKLLQEKYLNKKMFNDRMQKIEKICELNQIQNQECIRQLNFYQSNLDKVIEERKQVIDEIKAEDENLEEDRLKLIDDYNIRRVNHNSLIGNIEEEIRMKQYLDANISTTNFLIKESVLMKKQEIRHNMVAEIEKENKLKEARDNQIKTKKVADDLDRMREANERVAILFDDGENGESWDKKKEMKVTVREIEKKKDLEKYKLENKMRLENVEQENQRLEEELRTLQEANKGQDLTQYDNQHVRSKYEEVKEKIQIQKESIKECKESITKCTKITEKSNLLVSSIGRFAGVESGENELEILNEVGILTTVIFQIFLIFFRLLKGLKWLWKGLRIF